LSSEDALEYVESWLKQPCAEIISPGRDHWRIFRSLLAGSGTAGNLTSDAHLAAMAIEHGAMLYSADNDYQRFAGLLHRNPLK
jgi:predicted nucleic acid-binding protein